MACKLGSLHLLFHVVFIFCATGQNTTNRDVAEKAIQDLLLEFHAKDSSPDKTSFLTEDEFPQFLSYVTKHSESYISELIGDCVPTFNGSCQWKAECSGTKEIFNEYGSTDKKLYVPQLVDALPVAMHTLTATNCTHNLKETILTKRHAKKPSPGQAWGYGLGFVTTVAIISNIGAFLGTCMQKQFFKRLLQFLVAMGAGSLASTGLLVLIPEAFDIMSIEELGHDYVWKATVAIVSIYVFFCSERLLKTLLTKRRQRQRDKSFSVHAPDNIDDQTALQEKPGQIVNGRNQGHGHSHGAPGTEDDANKSTLAYMVMAGDMIHNFVDGLSIGAAFTTNITMGISVSLAIICEELPHELADIAILLHSGYSLKKAVLINFLSACVCYVGLIIGILLGINIAEASKWIFAIAGGLFLYVPLVDMLPDMSSHLDQLLMSGEKEVKIVAFLHTAGLILGAAIIVFIVNISAYIVVE